MQGAPRRRRRALPGTPRVDVVASVVGQDPFDAHAEQREPDGGPGQEARAGDTPLPGSGPRCRRGGCGRRRGPARRGGRASSAPGRPWGRRGPRGARGFRAAARGHRRAGPRQQRCHAPSPRRRLVDHGQARRGARAPGGSDHDRDRRAVHRGPGARGAHRSGSMATNWPTAWRACGRYARRRNVLGSAGTSCRRSRWRAAGAGSLRSWRWTLRRSPPSGRA